MTRRLKILHHAHCFDGAASASLFARYYRERVDATAEIVFAGKAHARGPVFDAADFDADDHAVVDFRYSADPRLNWWFDHHLSAFQSEGDEASFRERPPDHFFYDPQARSCTKFLADALTRTYGWDSARYAELIGWADLIDGAQFESAKQATALAQPALQLMTFVEHNNDAVRVRWLIESLSTRPLTEIAAEPAVQRMLATVRTDQTRAEQILRARVHLEHGVASFDVGDEGIDGYNKFLPYLIAPEACYVVAVSASAIRTKVSVGMNPWHPPVVLTNLARLCERYGGGGHAVVGAVTLPAGALPEARRIAAEIAEQLRASLPRGV
jgi:hypothetical protein